jgi:hypothetical protein
MPFVGIVDAWSDRDCRTLVLGMPMRYEVGVSRYAYHCRLASFRRVEGHVHVYREVLRRNSEMGLSRVWPDAGSRKTSPRCLPCSARYFPHHSTRLPH